MSSIKLNLNNYKTSTILYCLIFVVFFYPYLILGEVITPHRQSLELGLADMEQDRTHIENRKFSDFTSSYIPEIRSHLAGARSSWLALWDSNNELGRPLSQLAGFSPAYFPSWLLSKFTSDPWKYITVFSLLICFLTGLFILLFCLEMGIHPVAGLIAGIGIALSPQIVYWLTFPMFASVYCWAAGMLWAVTRLSKRSTLLNWSLLAFFGYSWLMTGYPQVIVYHVYLLLGYGLYLFYSIWKQERGKAFYFLGYVISSLAVGFILAVPAYRDLLILSAESARVNPDPSFFTYVLPELKNFHDITTLFVLGTVPEILGNSISPEFPFPYNGLSVTFPTIFLVVIALLSSFKKNWGWCLAIFLISLFAFSPPLYILGIQYLGFNLSSTNPMGTMLLPLSILVAFGADALAIETNLEKRLRWLRVAFLLVICVFIIGLTFARRNAFPLQWNVVVAMAGVITLLTFQYQRTRLLLLIVVMIISFGFTSFPLMLRQPLDQIATTSPLVEEIRGNLPAGSRYAVDGSGVAVLPPNLNASLDLPSLHS